MPTEKLLKPTPKRQRLLHPPDFAQAHYVDVKAHWKQIGPIFRSDDAAKIWKPCMTEFALNRANEYGWKFIEQPRHNLPKGYENCDWRWNTKRRGRHPAFWDYVCYGACHWIVDLCLYVVLSSDAVTPWKILHSQKHSTVWNGDLHEPILFDINYLALGISAHEALEATWRGTELEYGEYLKGYLHDH